MERKIVKCCLLTMSLVLISLFSFGQKKNLRQYYYWTNQAELAICDSNYATANACYDKAFALKIPFAKDLLSAYLLNLKLTHDVDKIETYAKYLVQCGDSELSERYASECEVDSQVYKLLQFIETNYHSLCDTALQHSLDEILEKDQSYRHGRGLNAFEDSMNHAIIRDIKGLSDRYKINIQTTGIYHLYNLHAPAIHYVRAELHDLQDLFKEHVLKGNIGADMYMRLEDEYLLVIENNKETDELKDPNGYGQGNFYFYKIGGTVFITYPTNIKMVNKHRKALGLSETFEDLVKKVSWEYTHNIMRWHSISTCIYGDKDENNAEAAKLKKEIDKEHAAGDFHRLYFDESVRK